MNSLLFLKPVMSKAVGLLLPVLFFAGCSSEADRSLVKDIGVVDTAAARTLVLYEDAGKVYLKACKPPATPPLTRACLSDETPKSLELAVYLYKLPFDVGPYPRDEQGLSLVSKALQDARNAVAGGNQNAVATVERLEPIKLNLEKILSVRDDLTAAQQDLTYYEYQDEFVKLQAPFGDTSHGGGGTSPIGMRFVKIPKGTFLMGSHSSESGRDSDETQHRVTITYDFFMQTTEVTQEQWSKVMGDNPSKFIAEQDCPGEYKQISGVALCPNNPVEQVSWHDVQFFIAKINERRDGFRYRLPTEAEWEYAARGGSTRPYSVSGNLADFAWFDGNAGGRTHAVAKLKSNAYGLYDVHGNVWEWTSDWYGDYPSSNITDPVGASSGSRRVNRGGSLYSTAQDCRSAYRRFWRPDTRNSNVGFRLLRMPSP